MPKNELKAECSSLILTEILTGPYAKKNFELAFSYKAIIIGFPNLTLTPLLSDIADKAAFLRATYNFRTSDAIHLATAIENGVDVLICNDKRWRQVKEIEVLVLDDLIS
jgi:predicted nucleic acid-binding protein